jgi:tRNA pseudouridine13 synthase
MTAEEPVFSWSRLPAVSDDLPGTGGRLRDAPEDFVVREIPAYLPEGRGSHLYLHVRKRGRTTRDLVVALREAGVPDARVGVAGLKDKHAVTEQWLSLPWASRDAAAALEALPGVEILERSRHRNKLGVGHLRGNRFEIVLRDVGPDALAAGRAKLERLATIGVPNYFGPQRFGRYGRNAVDGLKLLAGETVSGDRRLQRFFLSAVQSWIFNELLAERIRDGLYRTVLAGDWARKHDDRGGTFRVEDAEAEAPRAERLEISALLPLHGRKVRLSSGEPGRREEAALAALGLSWTDLTGRRGDRRPSRVVAEDARLDAVDGGVRLAFTLPKGSYATSLLREVSGQPVDAPLDAAD